MSETVKYFGFGANRDPKMIAAITGKSENELQGTPAILEGFGLAIQNLHQVPDTIARGSYLPISAQAILRGNWGDSFRSYVVFPRLGRQVAGTIWDLSPDDRERIRDWELVGDWYQDAVGVARTTEGELADVVTESLGNGQSYSLEVQGLDYETWLQPVDQFEIIATKARREYDERSWSPEGPAQTNKP